MSPSNMAQSVRDRLLNRMRETGANYQALLTRYALERLLYRISVSKFSEALVLKGAYTFLVWQGEPHRPTKDIDFLGYGAPEQLGNAFRHICGVDVEDDGALFDAESACVEEIRGQATYEGMRIQLTASIDTARLPLQIDVGFGDAITPEAQTATFPTLLGDVAAPKLKTYPQETVIAEKLECLVSWGMANTRLKDFYDLDYLARHFDFEGPVVTSAIQATFERRGTHVPEATPMALTTRFSQDTDKQAQWRAFGRRTGLADSGEDVGPVIRRLRHFLAPPLAAIREEEPFDRHWSAGGPWT